MKYINYLVTFIVFPKNLTTLSNSSIPTIFETHFIQKPQLSTAYNKSLGTYHSQSSENMHLSKHRLLLKISPYIPTSILS